MVRLRPVHDATSDLSFLNYSNLLLCKLNGELIQNGTSHAPLALPFCAAADIELWRPQFFILASSTWRKLACLGLIQADIVYSMYMLD